MFDRDPAEVDPITDYDQRSAEDGYDASGGGYNAITADGSEEGDIEDPLDPFPTGRLAVSEVVDVAGDSGEEEEPDISRAEPGAEPDDDSNQDRTDSGGRLPPPDLPPVPPDGTDPGGDGDDEPEPDPMDLPDPRQDGISMESFADALPGTRREFRQIVEGLRYQLTVPRETTRSDYIQTSKGNPNGARAEIGCTAEHRYSSDMESFDVQNGLHVTVRTSRQPATALEAIDIDLVARDFRDAQVTDYGDMDDAAYASAVAELQATLPAGTWAWIQRTIEVASTVPNRTLLPIDEILDTAPDDVTVYKSTTHKKVSRPEGSVIEVNWLDPEATNDAFKAQRGPDLAQQEVMLRTPSGERYVHRTYTDGTEQLYVESGDPTTRERLRAQGFAVMDLGVGSTISPEERQMGVQRPSDNLLREFTEILRRTAGLT